MMRLGDRLLAASVCRLLASMAEHRPNVFGGELLPPELMQIAYAATTRIYGPVVTRPSTSYSRDEAIVALCLAADVIEA
jgi:hypothetical protein